MITSGVALRTVSVSGRGSAERTAREGGISGKRIGTGCGDDQGSHEEPDRGPD